MTSTRTNYRSMTRPGSFEQLAYVQSITKEGAGHNDVVVHWLFTFTIVLLPKFLFTGRFGVVLPYLSSAV